MASVAEPSVGPTPPASAASSPAPEPSSDLPTAQAPPIASYEQLGSPARIADIHALVDATVNVVTSPAFHTHMAALASLRATPDSRETSEPERMFIVRRVSSLDPVSKPGPTSYALKGASCKHQTADTLFKGSLGSTTYLNQCTLDRAASRPTPGSDDVEAFACAINTIAHEWTHAVYGGDHHSLERYLDRGHKPSSGMLVSYTTGAVAQCTYLEAGHHLPGSFADCLNEVGTYILKTAPCNKGWAKNQAPPPN